MNTSPWPDLFHFASSLAHRIGAGAMVAIADEGAEALATLQSDLELYGLTVHRDPALLGQLAPHVHWRQWSSASDPPGLELAPVVVVAPDALETLGVTALKPITDRIDSLSGLVVAGVDPSKRVRSSSRAQSERCALINDLSSLGLPPPMACGYTRDGSHARSIHVQFVPGGSLLGAWRGPSSEPEVLALVACFNEEDIIARTVARLRAQGLRVHVIDNWSTDGSWKILHELSTEDAAVSVERFPDSPRNEYDLMSILARMDGIASHSPAEWIIRVDADEMIESFSPDVSLRQAFGIAGRAGFDAFDCTVIDFRPTVMSPGTAAQLPEYWEFGLRFGHRHIERAWANRRRTVGLSENAGHILPEPKRLFPLNLLLCHYPLRSPEHAVRKIYRDRLPRFENSPGRLEKGWHRQYDGYRRDDPFLWDRERLNLWQGDRSRTEWMVEFSTRAGLTFGEGSYRTSPFKSPPPSDRAEPGFGPRGQRRRPFWSRWLPQFVSDR